MAGFRKVGATKDPNSFFHYKVELFFASSQQIPSWRIQINLERWICYGHPIKFDGITFDQLLSFGS